MYLYWHSLSLILQQTIEIKQIVQLGRFILNSSVPFVI